LSKASSSPMASLLLTLQLTAPPDQRHHPNSIIAPLHSP
jgi:hypothetical protein